MRRLIVWCVLALAVAASPALAKGTARAKGPMKPCYLSFSLSQGTEDYAQPARVSGANFLDTTPVPEVGFSAEFAHQVVEDYAWNVGLDFRFGNIKQEATANAAPGTPTQTLTSTSWKVRVGGDRLGRIGDRFKWFLGPGVEFQSGRAKYENFFAAPNNDVKGEPTDRWGINGRLGGVLMLNPKTGIRGQIGSSFGRAGVDDMSGKTNWWYSDFEARWGVEFRIKG